MKHIPAEGAGRFARLVGWRCGLVGGAAAGVMQCCGGRSPSIVPSGIMGDDML